MAKKRSPIWTPPHLRNQSPSQTDKANATPRLGQRSARKSKYKQYLQKSASYAQEAGYSAFRRTSSYK